MTTVETKVNQENGSAATANEQAERKAALAPKPASNGKKHD